MLETAAILGVGICASFGILLWKLPKKIRRWVLKRQLVLDAAFTAFLLAVILPFSTGPTTLVGMTIATLAWTISIFGMRKLDLESIDLKGYLTMDPSFKEV